MAVSFILAITIILILKNILSFFYNRSPPVTAPGGGIVFPSANHFGTMRGPPQIFQSSESINGNRQQLSRPTVAPPRPPPTKPPPPPTRSISNTNLTNIPLSTPPSVSGGSSSNSTLAVNNNVNNNNFGSMKNLIESSKNNVTGSFNNINSNQVNSNGNIAPPLPPHRTCPAPPTVSRQASNVS